MKSLKEINILHFLNDGVRSTFVTLLPFIAKDLNINLSTVGFLGSAQPILVSLLALPAGFLAFRFGGFHLLIFLLIFYSAGAFSAAFSPNIFFIILSYFIAAAGFGMFHTVSFSLVAKITDKRSMGKVMGDFSSIGDIGRVALPPACVFLVYAFGWRISMLTIALLGFFAFLTLQYFRPKKEVYNLDDSKKETHGEFINHIFRLLKQRQLSLTLAAAVIDALASSPIYLFLPFVLLEKGVSLSQYGIIATVFLLGSLAGKTLLGRAVDKIGSLRIFILSEISMAAVLILITQSANFNITLILAFLLGSFTRGTTPIIQSMLSKTSHKIHYDKIFAISEFFIGIAAVTTVISMGVIAEKTNVLFVYYAASFLALIAIVPAFLLSLTKKD